MPYISPCNPFSPLSLHDRLGTVTLSPSSISQPSRLLTNEYLALNGCNRCGDRAVCATRAIGSGAISQSSSSESQRSLPFISKYEQNKFIKNAPQIALSREDTRILLTASQERNKIDVDDGPFCCSNIMILERESTMRNTDPEFALIKALLDALKDPERMEMQLGVLDAHELRGLDSVYKVNVYGPHVPFDAHSTWLYVHEDGLNGNASTDDRIFYAFMYCENVQPFSSITRYIAVGCKGDHEGSRYYRIGIYDSKWVRNVSGRPVWGTFGDQNLDSVMNMPVNKRTRLRHTTMDGHFQALVQAEDAKNLL